MTVTGLGWQDVLAAVRVVRPCAGPNLGFQQQLQEFETTQAKQVSRVKWGVREFKYTTALQGKVKLCIICVQYNKK